MESNISWFLWGSVSMLMGCMGGFILAHFVGFRAGEIQFPPA